MEGWWWRAEFVEAGRWKEGLGECVLLRRKGELINVSGRTQVGSHPETMSILAYEHSPSGSRRSSNARVN